MTFTCAYCDNVYKLKDSLKTHILKKHVSESKKGNVGVTNKTRRILCTFTSCNSNFSRNSEYHRHLESVHNVSLAKETLEFSNIQEFQNWKQNFEKKTTSMFVQTSSAKKTKSQVLYYYFCHRSFLGKKNKRKTANKEKSAGSNKISKSCPAMIKAASTNDAVKVELCSTHLGHDISVERLRLSIEDKNFLAGRLSAGVPPRHILADIRQNATSLNDRINYTEMDDLYNIKKAYGIKCSPIYDQSDRISVETEIKEQCNLPQADNPVSLMCSIKVKESKRLIKFAKPKPSKKLSRKKQSHENSLECDANIEILEEEKWSVKSATNPAQEYQVSHVKSNPCCMDICKKCKICLHMLMCSCDDYSVKQNICEHIHAVMQSQLEENDNNMSQEEFQDIIEDDKSLIFKPVLAHESEQLQPDREKIENSSHSRVVAKCSAILHTLEKATLSNEQLSDISKRLDGISASLSLV